MRRGTTGARRERGSSGWWKKVSDLVSGETGWWFWDKVESRIGDGRDTLFWEDEWLGNQSLKVRFPRLYHLSSNRGAKISDMGQWMEGAWRWEVRWRREPRERGREMVEELVETLTSIRLIQGKVDRWEWKGMTGGGFSVSKAYEVIEQVRRSNSMARSSFLFQQNLEIIGPF